MNNKHTARISEEFNKEIEIIKKARLESGKDKKSISTRKITNLLIRHVDWKTIKTDLINFDFSRGIIKNE